MLPLYQRAAMSPLSLTCITALAAGTMNMLPWGGPTTRAATALQVSAGELFVPVIPAMLVGLVDRLTRRLRRAAGSRRGGALLLPLELVEQAAARGRLARNRRRLLRLRRNLVEDRSGRALHVGEDRQHHAGEEERSAKPRGRARQRVRLPAPGHKPRAAADAERTTF